MTQTITTEDQQLLDLRNTVISITDVDDGEEEDDDKLETAELKKRLLEDLDKLICKKLIKGLEKKFGDRKFRVEMQHLTPPPSLGSNKGGGGYKFTLKRVTWIDGPTSHQVFYYIRDKYRYYLNSDKFKESMFVKTIPDIEKRYTSFFFPLPINGKGVESVQILINKVLSHEKVYYTVEVLDNKLNIKEVKGDSINEALSLLQIRLEGIYYREDTDSTTGAKPYDVHKYFLKKYIKDNDLNINTTTKD